MRAGLIYTGRSRVSDLDVNLAAACERVHVWEDWFIIVRRQSVFGLLRGGLFVFVVGSMSCQLCVARPCGIAVCIMWEPRLLAIRDTCGVWLPRPQHFLSVRLR